MHRFVIYNSHKHLIKHLIGVNEIQHIQMSIHEQYPQNN